MVGNLLASIVFHLLGRGFARVMIGRKIYAWCMMPKHNHLIFLATDGNSGDLLRDLRKFTSKKLQQMIEDNHQERVDAFDDGASRNKQVQCERKAVMATT